MTGLWRLLLVFAPLSFLTIGSGQSIVGDLRRQAVDVHGWMTDGRFVNLYALSRLTPGPGSVLSAMVGFDAAGLAGALVAAVGIFVPSSLLVFGLAHLWSRYRGARWQVAVERGLAPVAAGLVLASSWALLNAAQGGWLAWVVALGSTTLLLTTRVSPFVLLGIGGVVYGLVPVWRWEIYPHIVDVGIMPT